MADKKDNKKESHGHHILPDSMGTKILVALLIMTVVTVLAAQVDLGILNFPLAMFIATIKALMVVLIFMGLKYDTNDNRAIFGISFVFFGIFVVLTFADIIPRGDTFVKGPFFKEVSGSESAGGKSFARFWESSPEKIAFGKEKYGLLCATCHGNTGMGDGIAAGGLNPRNLTVADGWKSGRKPHEVFGTLTKGLGNFMPGFKDSIPTQERWAVVHYVLSLGPDGPKSTDEDYRNAGIKDLSRDDGGFVAAVSKNIPVDLAIDILTEEAGSR